MQFYLAKLPQQSLKNWTTFYSNIWSHCMRRELDWRQQYSSVGNLGTQVSILLEFSQRISIECFVLLDNLIKQMFSSFHGMLGRSQTACGLRTQTLSTILPSTGQNQHYRNILLYKTFVISIMVSHFDNKHRCLIEKNVPIVFSLPSRWQDGAESLGMERALAVYGFTEAPFKVVRKYFGNVQIDKLRL